MSLFFIDIVGVEVFWPGLIVLGLLIGFLTGLFGIGGGFLVTPCLKIIFGIPYPIAVGSSLAQILITGSVSAWKHWRNQKVDVLLGLIMAGGALVGTEIGVQLLDLLGTRSYLLVHSKELPALDLILNIIFFVLLAGVGFCTGKESFGSNAKEEVDLTLPHKIQCLKIPPLIALPQCGITSLSIWVPLILSVMVGVFTGLLGIGGGFINLPILIYILGVPTAIAVGSSSFQIFFASGYGAIRHMLQGNVELLLVAFFLMGSLVGVQLGVRAANLVGGRNIRRYYVLVISAGMLVVLGDLLSSVFL
ncbi:sulfite exporter TauE/SafE family protein [Desulfitobacterium chlororespirans]|uniref:Probable membrane transporter protein n=1 Tax=Desulfitobacterium chlororespirans DSM 11544 TaxID=1121395 RepID=A0A1M7UQJ8_9FIRM|nr:sulfite exporter TauE/SafE family protein [Desulfitobacterium chlororespirans]SHN85311.1 hypothetical protein SAMN02745215_04421 [Desulfitobacterium chlororespirans DSM 11544]